MLHFTDDDKNAYKEYKQNKLKIQSQVDKYSNKLNKQYEESLSKWQINLFDNIDNSIYEYHCLLIIKYIMSLMSAIMLFITLFTTQNDTSTLRAIIASCVIYTICFLSISFTTFIYICVKRYKKELKDLF